MPQLATLLSVLEEARELLAAADNDFTWSSWQDRDDALSEIDMLLSELRAGIVPSALTLNVLLSKRRRCWRVSAGITMVGAIFLGVMAGHRELSR